MNEKFEDMSRPEWSNRLSRFRRHLEMGSINNEEFASAITDLLLDVDTEELQACFTELSKAEVKLIDKLFEQEFRSNEFEPSIFRFLSPNVETNLTELISHLKAKYSLIDHLLRSTAIES